MGEAIEDLPHHLVLRFERAGEEKDAVGSTGSYAHEPRRSRTARSEAPSGRRLISKRGCVSLTPTG